jgi:hypothetical protein
MAVPQRIDMHLSETVVHSFIVKLWFEKTKKGAAGTIWHGYITHVPSGRRHYLKDLSGVTDFIEPYFNEMGVENGLRGRVRRWLRRLDIN